MGIKYENLIKPHWALLCIQKWVATLLLLLLILLLYQGLNFFYLGKQQGSDSFNYYILPPIVSGILLLTVPIRNVKIIKTTVVIAILPLHQNLG